VAGTALTAGSQRLRIALAVPALVGIFFLGQGILSRRPLRLDLTPERRYSLSDHARKILDTLPADVRILAFLRTQDPRNPAIEDLLARVKARTSRISYQIVDVNKSPALAREYGVDSYGALVVESEGRRRVFSNPREEVLMAALLQVTRQQRKVVGVVVGHGEGNFHETDRRRGYSTARVMLEQEYYDVRPISLLTDDVPPEVGVLVIAGARKDFMPEELAAFERYLDRPGHALVMLDPFQAPALATTLARYGVDLSPDVVVDPTARLYGGEFLTMRIPIDPRDHPVIGPLDAPPLFPLTRSVRPATDVPEVLGTTVFLRTGPESWATTDRSVLTTGESTFVSGRDLRGPIPVGLETTFRTLTPPGAEPRLGRMIVLGNSRFVDNFFIEFLGNKDLFVNAVDWLAREPSAISQRPRRQQLGLHQFYVSAEQGSLAFWTTAVAQPALFGLLALLLTMRRRWGS
jgi:gliding motility-associatede transport system auxiliary component